MELTVITALLPAVISPPSRSAGGLGHGRTWWSMEIVGSLNALIISRCLVVAAYEKKMTRVYFGTIRRPKTAVGNVWTNIMP